MMDLNRRVKQIIPANPGTKAVLHSTEAGENPLIFEDVLCWALVVCETDRSLGEVQFPFVVGMVSDNRNGMIVFADEVEGDEFDTFMGYIPDMSKADLDWWDREARKRRARCLEIRANHAKPPIEEICESCNTEHKRHKNCTRAWRDDNGQRHGCSCSCVDQEKKKQDLDRLAH